jgi:tripartite ATP-independent transporter DctP family solute receptor
VHPGRHATLPTAHGVEEMMRLTRRQFGSAALAATAAGTVFNKHVFAQVNKISMKMGGNLSTNHPAMLAVEKACERIRKESSGEIDIQFHNNLQLGSEPAMHSQLRSGALELMTTSGLILQTLVPIAGISGMAFAFKDYPQVWAALDGDLGADMRASMQKFGIYGFPKNMDNGFRNITTSTKPINVVEDLKGLKIRVPPSPVWVTLFTALGASPTSINLNELYTSLQTKVVDAQENPLVLIEAGKFYEVQKYCSMTGHLWDGCWPIANAKIWKGLPSDAQALISRVFDEETVRQREDVARMNVELERALKEKGMVFNRPDRDQFREHLSKAGFYAEWKKKYGPQPWATLEKYAGTLS